MRPHGNYSVGKASALEIIFSAALCYVVLNVTTTEIKPRNTSPNGYFGLAIGFTVVSSAIAIGPVSGCSLNPAVSIGAIAASSVHFGSKVALAYWAPFVFSPFAGAMLGTLLFFLVRGGYTCTNEFLHTAMVDDDIEELAPLMPEPIPVYLPPLQPEVEPISADAGELEVMTRRKSTALRRGGSIYFNEEYASNQMICGINWHVSPDHTSRGGGLGVDVDLSCLKFRKNGRYTGSVYFNTPVDAENGIKHSGDDIMGTASDDGGDTEQILFQINNLQRGVDVLLLVATIFSAGVDSFKKLNRFSCHVVDADSNKELCSYRKEQAGGGNAMVIGMIYRRGDRWAFKAIDDTFAVREHATARSLAEKGEIPCDKYVQMALAESRSAAVR
jgi:stress response protein SCP2